MASPIRFRYATARKAREEESFAVSLKIRAIKKAASPALAGKATWGFGWGNFMPLLLVLLPAARVWLRAVSLCSLRSLAANFSFQI